MRTEALCLSEKGTSTFAWLSQEEASWEINLDCVVKARPLERSNFAADGSAFVPAAVIVNCQPPATLSLEGITLGKVQTMLDIDALFVGLDLEVLTQILLKAEAHYSWTGESTLAAVARTLTADQCSIEDLDLEYVTNKVTCMIATCSNSTNHPTPALRGQWPNEWRGLYLGEGPKGYKDNFDALRKTVPSQPWHQVWEPPSDSSAEADHSRYDFPINGRVHPSDDCYMPLLIAIARGRSLFMTEDGMIGIGPLCTHPGDSVVILKGSRVPFILTPEALYRNSSAGWDMGMDLVKDADKFIRSIENLRATSPETRIRSMSPPGKNEHYHEWLTENIARLIQAQQQLRLSQLATRPSSSNLLLRSGTPLENLFNASLTKKIGELNDHLDTVLAPLLFKGEAYVHGFMHGEVEECLRTGYRSWQTITIR